MTRAIIFDADGMIIHGDRFSDRLEKEYGISTSVTSAFFSSEFQDCLIGRKDLKQILPAYFDSWGWKGTLEELLAFWFSPLANQIDQRFETATSHLRENGISCYLATNNERYRAENLLHDRGIEKWFDGVFASYTLGVKKPEADFFDVIIKTSKATKGDIQFWDDDQENIDGAMKSGLDAHLYLDFDQFFETVKPLS